jgi:hypothetical protein
MSRVSTEVREESTYRSPAGAVVIVSDVPTETVVMPDGTSHKTYSMAVAMRLDELLNRALEQDSTPGTVQHLQF